jgi:Na+/H+ antiporter NhaA
MSSRHEETATDATTAPFARRTAWMRNLETPLRRFLRTETASAGALLGATVAALVWANASPSSYARVWDATLSVHLSGHGLSHDLRFWLNSGLMTFFFFVVGLEARREFDIGELRERRRLALPVAAGIGGMVVPVAIFLAFSAGHSSAHGWGVSMSTDTAFALGMLAIVGRRLPSRVRAFMLTVAVVDDVAALGVIAVAYSGPIHRDALIVAALVFAAIVAAVVAGVRGGALYLALGIVCWIALSQSGIDPIVIGLAMGLLTFAAPASRSDLERASQLFRRFREQPTPELARSARAGLASALSPNERLQQLFHPWTSYAIVPLFALANAGIVLDRHLLGRAFESRITLGIVAGYVLGKPIGVFAGTFVVCRLSRGRVRAPVGWASLGATGSIAGIGFTVSLLIAGLAFTGDALAEAKIGILVAALCASAATWLVFQATALLPRRVRLRALIGTVETMVDLAVDVDVERDHVRGPAEAAVTLVEYGDFQCPFCGQAEPVVRELLADFGDLRYVWRHLPLNDVHPRAQRAAEAAEAAAAQGAFWEMADVLLSHQDALADADLVEHARGLGLDVERFADDLERHSGAGRIADDVEGADESSVSGTPTFFVNGRRHHGAYDVETLSRAVRAAKARALVAAPA